MSLPAGARLSQLRDHDWTAAQVNPRVKLDSATADVKLSAVNLNARPDRTIIVVRRIGITMLIIGSVTAIAVTASSETAEALGYYDLVDHTLWLPIHLIGGCGICLALTGLAFLGVVRLLEPNDR